MRVLVGCEFSGRVRDAFRARGHNAWSCDLLPSEQPSPYHIQNDLFTVLKWSAPYRKPLNPSTDEYFYRAWDLLLFFWPCTNMAVSGARWFHLKQEQQAADIEAFRRLAEWPGIPRTAGENPIGVLSTQYRKPDQIIQPWQFGHGEVKATCLWLRNLPFTPVYKDRTGTTGPGPSRSPVAGSLENRSRTLPGIADAMATQWGSL